MDDFVPLLQEHKFALIGALVIGFIVRMLKQDVGFTPTIPARWRPLAALALGFVEVGLLKIDKGVSWKTALVDGLLAAAIAMASNDVLIKAIRNGKEIPVEAPKEPKDPPGAGPTALLVFLAAVCLVAGCAAALKASAEGAFTAEHLACTDNSPTREAAEACQREVDRRWGVIEITYADASVVDFVDGDAGSEQ